MFRLKFIRYLSLFLLALIVGYLGYLQVIRGEYFYRLSQNNSIRVIPSEGRRGAILDRRGVVLADNRLSFNVALIPQYLGDLDAALAFLSRILDQPVSDLRRRYQLQKLSPFTPVVVAERINRINAIAIQQGSFQFPGVIIQETFERIYPHDETGAHVLGYIGEINESRMRQLKQYGYRPQSLVGYSGVEEYYDAVLRGESGGKQVQVNSRGQQVRLLSIKDPTVGQNVMLTIDQRLQDMAHRVLNNRRGSIVVMDADTGEILSLVSTPSFNPNDFTIKERRDRIRRYFRDRRSPLLNRAISGQYPPGSVFKIPVALAGLDSRKMTKDTVFHCPGYMELGGTRFGCTHVHEDEDLSDAITHSCNVYMYHIGRLIGAGPIARMAQDMGLGRVTGVDLPYEQTGMIPRKNAKRRWYQGDTLNISIGQGDVLTTPLQLTRMMAVMGNGGYLVRPYVAAREANQSARSRKKVSVQDSHMLTVNQGMRRVVSDPEGTAHLLNRSDLPIHGKTGTAQAGGDQDHHAWFTGFVQLPNKEGADYAGRTLAFTVFLENGGSSQNAVILTRQLFIKMKNAKVM